MNRYVLSGGKTIKGFWQELFHGTKKNVNFLLCQWAQPIDTTMPIKIQAASEMISQYHSKRAYKYMFGNMFPNKKVNVVIARQKRFINQLQWAEVIYFEGGTTIPLMETLCTYHKWWESVSDKKIGGNSAGANALCSYCYGLDAQQVLVSRGPVPVAIVVHYLSNYNGYEYDDWANMVSRLKTTNLPVVKLQEEQYAAYSL